MILFESVNGFLRPFYFWVHLCVRFSGGVLEGIVILLMIESLISQIILATHLSHLYILLYYIIYTMIVSIITSSSVLLLLYYCNSIYLY
jgi:hypothetical protein